MRSLLPILNIGLNKKSWVSRSCDETISIGREIGRNILPGTIFCLFGDLGAGKTTLIKGIVSGITGHSPQSVNSPTFVYLNIYSGEAPVFHFDLYRLETAEDFLSMGFEEMLFSEGICLIEWSERIASLLPRDVAKITIKEQEMGREITLSWTSE